MTTNDLLDLFPPGSTDDADGMLTIGGCRADDLAAEFGTPVLVVAEDALRERAREYRTELAERWPNSRVVFASKAFPCTAMQRVMVQEGLGLDVAGGGEILTALKAGVDPALIVLHGNAKSTEEITMAVENGVGLVVVDGPDDVDRLEAIVPAGRDPGRPGPDHPRRHRRHPRARADRARGLEVRPGAGGRGGADPADRAQPAGARCAGCTRMSARRSCEPEPLAAAVAPLRALGEFEIYDLGGGLGARYTWADQPPSVADYLDVLIGAAREHLPAQAQIIIEPGRSMVAAAAATIYRVTTVKRGSITFVAVDGGMGDNLEVALFGQRFEAGIADRLDATGRRDRDRRRAALRERRRAGRRRAAGRAARSAICWPCRPPGPTASPCPTTTTATAGSRWCSPPTAASRLVVRRETWERP